MGRADKKFCNDQWRNSFNNNLNKDANECVRKVSVIRKKTGKFYKKSCLKKKLEQLKKSCC